jgi:hypothetical protein
MSLRLFSLCAVPLAALLACGGAEESSSAAAQCVTGGAIQVTTTTASPSCLAVPLGGGLTFTNSGSELVTIRSNPHLTHGSCPELDTLPTLGAGESVSVTMPSTAKSCGYHRHETGAPLGSIRVGQGGGGPGDPYEQ